MAFDPKEVKKGDPISARGYNELGQAVKRGRHISGGAGMYARDVGDGLELAIAEYEAMDFQITGGPDAHGGYDWIQVVQDGTTKQWTQTGITGLAAHGDGVYPRNFGLPRPSGRVLVLIPPLRRVGNYVHAGQAWLNVGIGAKLPADDTVYHAVRAEGSSQWVFDALSPELSTTSDASVYVCCHSHSTSSTSSDGCPTGACPQCDGKAACHVSVQIDESLIGPSFSNPVCAGLFGIFNTVHVGGCAWSATIKQGANTMTVTLFWNGSRWEVEAMITGATGSGVAVYFGDGYDCKTVQTFDFSAGDSTCVCSNGGTCVVSVTPGD